MSDAPPPPSEEPASPVFSDEPISSKEAGTSVDDGKGRIFPCEGCGADLEFNIGVQQLKCPYCGYEKELQIAEDAEVQEQDFHAILARMEELHEHDRHDETGQSEVRCSACGGTVVFTGSLTSSECPYCASPIQLDDVHDAEHRIPADGVLPFFVDKDAARENLNAWINSRWFAPNDFKQKGGDGKFNGIYLPYWTYDTFTANAYSGQRGENYTVTVGTGDNKRTETRTRWYPASGAFQRFFDDVLVLATRGLPRKLMQKLEPWPLAKCVPFTQEVLAGYLARTYEIELRESFVEAKQRIDEALESDVRSRIGGDKQRIHSIKTRYDALTFKHVLLPVWLLAYRYHEKTYQVMINAGTGEVQGERPYSWVKIALTVLGGLALIGGAILGIQLAR